MMVFLAKRLLLLLLAWPLITGSMALRRWYLEESYRQAEELGNDTARLRYLRKLVLGWGERDYREEVEKLLFAMAYKRSDSASADPKILEAYFWHQCRSLTKQGHEITQEEQERMMKILDRLEKEGGDAADMIYRSRIFLWEPEEKNEALFQPIRAKAIEILLATREPHLYEKLFALAQQSSRLKHEVGMCLLRFLDKEELYNFASYLQRKILPFLLSLEQKGEWPSDFAVLFLERVVLQLPEEFRNERHRLLLRYAQHPEASLRAKALRAFQEMLASSFLRDQDKAWVKEILPDLERIVAKAMGDGDLLVRRAAFSLLVLCWEHFPSPSLPGIDAWWQKSAESDPGIQGLAVLELARIGQFPERVWTIFENDWERTELPLRHAFLDALPFLWAKVDNRERSWKIFQKALADPDATIQSDAILRVKDIYHGLGSQRQEDIRSLLIELGNAHDSDVRKSSLSVLAGFLGELPSEPLYLRSYRLQTALEWMLNEYSYSLSEEVMPHIYRFEGVSEEYREQVWDLLTKAIQDENPAVRKMALWGTWSTVYLYPQSITKVWDFWKKACEDKEETVRMIAFWAACSLLGRLPESYGEKTWPLLAQAGHDPCLAIKDISMWLLGAVLEATGGKVPPQGIDAIYSLLSYPEARIRNNAIWAFQYVDSGLIEAQGRKFWEAMKKSAEDRHRSVRLHVINTVSMVLCRLPEDSPLHGEAWEIIERCMKQDILEDPGSNTFAWLPQYHAWPEPLTEKIFLLLSGILRCAREDKDQMMEIVLPETMQVSGEFLSFLLHRGYSTASEQGFAGKFLAHCRHPIVGLWKKYPPPPWCLPGSSLLTTQEAFAPLPMAEGLFRMSCSGSLHSKIMAEKWSRRFKSLSEK